MDTRIKKLQNKIKDLQDQYRELTSSVEDIYDTINDFKNPEPTLSHNPIHHTTKQSIQKPIQKSIQKPDNKSSNDDITKFIEYLKTYFPESKEDQTTRKEYLTYFQELNNPDRKSLLNTCAALTTFDKTFSSKPKLFHILESSISEYHKKMVLGKLQILNKMDTNDTEYFKLSQWIDNITTIPFNNYQTPEYISKPPYEVITTARATLDNVIYGQSTAKQHILEIIARMISNPATCGQVFAVEGEPGIGKTTLIKHGLSKVLGLPFIFISLGGCSDGSYLYGENYSYVGSKPGMIIQSVKSARCMNPIFYFDELDKVSATDRGLEIINTLVHLTDFSQNSTFLDHYMDGIPIDLSRAIFIFSFNDRSRISPILLDRMEIIKMMGYNYKEKRKIMMDYLLPKIIPKFYSSNSGKIECKIGENKEDKRYIIKKLICYSGKVVQRNSKMLNIHQIIMRRRKLMKKQKLKQKLNSGVRLIEQRLEKCIARLVMNNLETNKLDKSDLKRSIKRSRKIVITKEIVLQCNI